MENKVQKWVDWSKCFLASPVVPMTGDMAESFMGCAAMESAPDFPPPVIVRSFPFQLFSSRAYSIGLDTTESAMAFFALNSTSPANAVMWAYVFRYHQLVTGHKITMAEVAKVFPNGFPSDDHLEELWDMQKVDSSNLLDHLDGSDLVLPQGTLEGGDW